MMIPLHSLASSFNRELAIITLSPEIGVLLRQGCAYLYIIQMVQNSLTAYYLWKDQKRSSYRAIALFLIIQTFSDICLIWLLIGYPSPSPTRYAYLPWFLGIALTNICGLFVLRMTFREARLIGRKK